MRINFNIEENAQSLLIHGEAQRMYLLNSANEQISIDKEYIITTGRYGFGRGYKKTPLGVHKIKEKIGENCKVGAIFKSDLSWGSKIAPIQTDPKTVHGEAYMTTRLLALDGQEDHNRRSYLIGIYIHGTNHEAFLGTPRSKGCIRVSNSDILELYDLLSVGTYVNILDKI
jgi:hypothetical protein